jgi:hypothetical protein
MAGEADLEAPGMKLRFFALCVTLVLMGCSGDEPESESKKEGAFDDLVGTMDRAENTEQQIMDAAENRRREIDEQQN